MRAIVWHVIRGVGRTLLTARQTWAITAALVLVAATVASAQATERSIAPDLLRIVERGQLVVAMLDGERYPFFYKDQGGEWRGADIDMAKDIARELGVELVIDRVATTFDAIVDRVDAGHADIAISKLSTTLRRAQSIYYTQPYIKLRQCLVVNRVHFAATKRENEDPASVVGELGGRVGVLANSSYVEFARRRFPRAEIVEIDTINGLFEAVQRGDVLAALYDEHEVKQYAFAHPEWLVDVSVRLFSDSPDLIAIGVSWRNPGLKEWLDAYLRVNGVNWSIDEMLRAYERP